MDNRPLRAGGRTSEVLMDLMSCPDCEASYYVESVAYRAGWPCRNCERGDLRLLVRNIEHLPLGALPYDNAAAAAAAATPSGGID
jgi:hypothetical protein